MQTQKKVEKELQTLLDRGHIEKLEIVLRQKPQLAESHNSKKESYIKLFLDSKFMNKLIHKNKYEMISIDSVIQLKSHNISVKTKRTDPVFTTIDLMYAYSHRNLHPGTARHFNFNLLIGYMTGTYRFKTRFYGLTDMQTKTQKAIDTTLIGLPNK